MLQSPTISRILSDKFDGKRSASKSKLRCNDEPGERRFEKSQYSKLKNSSVRSR